jgi:hypothetical protein
VGDFTLSVKIAVISGQIDYKKLNSSLGEREYAFSKAIVWISMLNGGNRPKRWLKVRKDGTKVNFEIIQSDADFENGLNELKKYLAEIKSEYEIEIKLKI